MIRVLLVDDEALVRVGLKSLVPWNELGYEVVGEAANGEAAQKLLDELRPQLMITDIVMPRLNGIELVQNAKKKYPEMIAIVLSGYNEYEMVREAMKYGASDYLLKLNLNRESLSELLLSLREENFALDVPADERSTQSGKLALRHKIKRAIGSGSEDAEQDGSLPAFAESAFMTMGLINSNLYMNMERYTPQDAKHIELTIVDILEEILDNFYSGCALEWGGGSFVLALFGDAFERGQLEAMGKAMLTMLKTYVNIDSAIAFSDPFQSPAVLAPAFRQARHAIHRIFRSGFHTIHFAADADPEPPLPDRDAQLAECLSRALIIRDTQAVKEAFRHAASSITGFARRGEACDWINQIVCLCDLRLGEAFAAEKQEALLSPEQLYMYKTMDELAEWFSRYTDFVLSFLEAEDGNQVHPVIKRAKRYIQDHFSEPITLHDAADALSISTGYLSTLFTKSIGVNFTEYVNQTKIERAKEILREGGHKVYEAAYLLGFDNVCYFNKLFKRHVGCTPGQYQNYAQREL